MTRYSLLSLVLGTLLLGACNGSGGTGQSFSGYGMQTGGNGMQTPVPEQQAYATPVPQVAPTTSDWRSQVQVNHGEFQQMANNLRQQINAMGAQAQVWLFANEFTVVAMIQASYAGGQGYRIGVFENGQEQAYNMVYLGQNQQGAHCFKSEFQDTNQPTVLMAQDLSWIMINNHVQLMAATPDQCDQAYANGKARSENFARRYAVFSDLFKAINQHYPGGVESEENIFLYGNRQEVVLIAKIPQANALAIGDFVQWNTTVGDLYQQQSTPQGGPQFIAVINGQRIPVEMTPNEMQIRINGTVFERLTPEAAYQVVDNARLAFDKAQGYNYFINQYSIWQNEYANKMAYVNNASVKEVYKFSARSAMIDCQQKMREIRQRAARVGYNIQPGVYEGADNGALQSSLNNYQWARDGVTYGQSDPAYQIDNRGNWHPLY